MKVDKQRPNRCWVWTANKNNKGYGMFSVNSYIGKRLAHRLSYEHFKGPIPKGKLILHSCDNPACVNPDHLRVGTHKQNVNDMDSRNRRVSNPCRGSANHNAILSDAEVKQIINRYTSGECASALAKEYGVKSINDYISGKSYHHLFKDSATLQRVKLNNQRSAAKINQQIADEIRTRLKNGEFGKDLALHYGIHKATISDIKLNKIWAG